MVTVSIEGIAAFLNTDGGFLIIGVADNKKIIGIERDLEFCSNKNIDGFELKLRDRIKSDFRPNPIGLIDINFESIEDQTICRVDVNPSTDIIYVENEIWVRDGNRKLNLKGQDLIEWVRRENPIH